ncbi:hypothetical protein DH2020_043268 [Rehmannia glutinosa]|uniref:Uncharacterized protein n=1 Tax=Rehmannia glutinosa TaxID=99300 RepID=A0ABR0UL22_REHGL
MIVNSFYELEKCYVDYWNEKIGPKAFCVGPLLAAQISPSENLEKLNYINFLDEKLENQEPVLYVAFGTQAEVSSEQIREIAKGLEKSEASFLWALNPNGPGCIDFFQEFEERGFESLRVELGDGKHLRRGSDSCGAVHGGAAFEREVLAEEIGVGLRLCQMGIGPGFVAAEEVERMVRGAYGW